MTNSLSKKEIAQIVTDIHLLLQSIQDRLSIIERKVLYLPPPAIPQMQYYDYYSTHNPTAGYSQHTVH